MSQAARDHAYGVPKTTLVDQVSGRVIDGTKPEPRPMRRRKSLVHT